MTDPASYLRAYDDQLRTDTETPGASSVTRLGPLRLVTFAAGRGFITYRDLAGDRPLDGLVAEALDHFRADPQIERVEAAGGSSPFREATSRASGVARHSRRSVAGASTAR